MIFLVFTVGAVIGSFLNVCIFRLPENLSIIMPGSSCPFCRTKIRFYDNIPILSYIFLLGRCRRCGKSISFVYPFVEIITAVFAILLFNRYGLSFKAAVYFCLICSLIIISFIDLKHYIIPDSISISGIIIGFAISFVPDLTIGSIESLISIFFGGGVLLIIGIVYEKLTSREGIGGGDIKLLAMIGAFMGLKNIVLILFLSSILGSIIGLFIMGITKNSTRHTVIPFGPFISLATIITVFYGEQIISSYLELFYV